MDSISPDIAEKLRNRDFAKLIQRVQRGGKLSRTVRAMLDEVFTILSASGGGVG